MESDMQLGYMKLSPDAFSPVKGSKHSAGYDIRSLCDVVIPKEDRKLVRTGIAVVLPKNCYGRIAPRSGLSLNYFINIGAGVVDRDYTGEIMVLLFNHSKFDYHVKRGDKIAQLICECIIYPDLIEVSHIDTTERADKGFGSTEKMTTQSTSPDFVHDETETGETVTIAQDEENNEAGPCLFNVVTLLENLVLLGMNSVNNWERVLSSLKTNLEVMSCPHLVNLYFVLRLIHQTLSNHIYSIPDSAHKIIALNENEMSYDEIMSILTSLLRKKSIKDKVFTFQTVQRIMSIIRSILCESELANVVAKDSKKRKITHLKQTLKKKRSSNTTSGSDSSAASSASSSDCDSDEDAFEQLFKVSSRKSKRSNKKVPITIKQLLQYQKNNKRYKLTTPGEQGSHLVKIEITDCKDLKKCSSEKMYWTKVSKKGYFLVDSPKDDLLKKVSEILIEVGNRFDSIENVSTEISKIDEKRNLKY